MKYASSLRRTLLCAAAALGGACTSVDGPSPVLIPNQELVLSRSVSIPADTIALAVSIYLIVDPLAPNWRIEQYDMGNGRYVIALKKKRYSTGGDGESHQVFRRHVETILRAQGFVAYEVLEYNEGIESNVAIAQRVSHGVVQFARAGVRP